ncbi:MAG: AMP-binding protein [Pseudomonadota bacterium]|nr:AMP-binding protein [Pseudomonadota bacterium]
MARTGEVDSFARDALPSREQWPDLLVEQAGLSYPEQLNCVSELLDSWLARGMGDRPCVYSLTERWSYAELAARVNRIANVLIRQLGVIPGNRVLLRAPNTPLALASTLAVMKAGGIAVPTMPLLRARELAFMIGKGRIALALCDHRLLDELRRAQEQAPELRRIVPMGGHRSDDLVAAMASEPAAFEAWPTLADDTCLIAFTSGTTGVPKGTMHFHRDMLAVCDTYGRHVLRERRGHLHRLRADRVRLWDRRGGAVSL